jgi:imidazole glycerol-phosphate synthase subunit HisH
MIAIVNCGFNVSSVEFAFQRLGEKTVLTLDPKIIQSATHVVLPGVGHATHAIEKLIKANLVSLIRDLKQPVLGICLGMHMLCKFSTEGNVECLGLFPENVLPLLSNSKIVVPHMGWNQLKIKDCSLEIVNDIKEKDFVYFAHSYYVPIGEYTVAATEYGVNISAIFQYKNFVGMQFHPEKSGKIGEKLLCNFLEMSK